MKIELIHTQKALGKTFLTLAPYSVNPYRGCEFRCKYCYAQYNKNVKRDVLGVKINLPQILEKELKYKRVEKVVLGGSCECFTYSELKYRITHKILEILNRNNISYIILTKSNLIKEYLPLIQENKESKIFFTFNFTQEEIKNILEEKSPSLTSRLEAIKEMKEKGVYFRIHMGPFIPYISDLDEIFSLFKDIAYDINIEIYHHRLGNFNQVIESLRENNVSYEKIEKLVSVYNQEENFYKFSREFKEEILEKAKGYRFRIFYIVPRWESYYTQDINYEKPVYLPIEGELLFQGLDGLKNILEKEFQFLPNFNQIRDLKRLAYEICLIKNIKLSDLIKELKENPHITKAGGRNKFFVIKEHLINLRFPLTKKFSQIDTRTIYLSELKKPFENCFHPSREKVIPEKVFVEKEVRNSYLMKRIKELFPSIEIQEVAYYSEYLKTHKFNPADFKRPMFFIVKERWDFIKRCPCTKGVLSCNYWIFNLGFGCPLDCSYCYLQVYSNFPGIILPSNLDDFFNKFEEFYKKLKRPIRIGTGEFCDSLALDDITQYSKKLVNFFKNKNLFFELKTKSKNINNLLEIEPSSNIVISFSLNPQRIIEKEELATASLEERIESAKRVQEKGYSLGFHFDPIIYFDSWERLYKEVIDKLYQELKPPFTWISMGTLRGPKKLKDIAERRFPQSRIFYRELFLGEDKKLRYPKFLRKEIYKKVLTWIREKDGKTPVYLCMEDREIWQGMDRKFNSSFDVERYLLGL